MSPTPASLWLRLAAAIYDLFPLLALWMLTAALVLFAAHGDIDVAHPPLAYRTALRAALGAVTAAYFVISWAHGGQTIGMRAWRLRLNGEDGAPLPWRRALLRFGAMVLSVCALGLGFFWCLIDRDKRAWHDIIAHTQVTRLPKA